LWSIDADVRSLERDYGFDHCVVSCLHGMETSDEEKHKIWAQLLDVWWDIVSMYIVCSTRSTDAFSAAAATFVKVYYMRDLAKLSDVTYAWSPISIWYM
jgi:hypothetical protein